MSSTWKSRPQVCACTVSRNADGLTQIPKGANSNIVTKTPKIRGLRTIKREILKLVEMYIKKAEDLDAIAENLIPHLLDAVLGDYSRNVPAARDAEVLNVMTTIMNRLGVCGPLLGVGQRLY